MINLKTPHGALLTNTSIKKKLIFSKSDGTRM